MAHRHTASWNTIISGYVNSGSFSTAWEVLKTMKRLAFRSTTILSEVLGLRYGLQVHADILKMGFDDNEYAASALQHMYAKCSRVEDANKVFKHMKEWNIIPSDTVIGRFTEMGNLRHCLKLFRCLEIESVGVDDATFARILTFAL